MKVKSEDEIIAELMRLRDEILRLDAAMQAADNADLPGLAELERNLMRALAREDALMWVMGE